MSDAHILIVDDDPAIRELLRRITERAGFTAHTAGDGMEALALLDQHRYAVLLLDLMMPRVNGYEVVEALKTAAHRPTVVIVSAMAGLSTRQLDTNIVHSVVHKPFDVEMVSQLLADTVRSVSEAGPLLADMDDLPNRLIC